MNPITWPIGLSLISVFALVIAETREYRPGVWLFKPIASCCFLWLAWLAGAAETDYGRWLLAGLVACLLGDVFLIPKHDGSFLAGLCSFLLGHLLFAVAFLQSDLQLAVLGIAAIPSLALAVFSLLWLRPHLPDNMRIPVVCYMLVICTMLTCASNSYGLAAAPWILAGAWGFAISDLAVARNQFVKPQALNRAWGLPLYFGSQMLLAWSPTLMNTVH